MSFDAFKRFEAACRAEGFTIRQFMLGRKTRELVAFGERHGLTQDDLIEVLKVLNADIDDVIMNGSPNVCCGRA